MRWAVLALLAVAPSVAHAVEPPSPPPPALTAEQQALAQLAAAQWQREATLQVQVLLLQAEIERLKTAAKPAPEPPK